MEPAVVSRCRWGAAAPTQREALKGPAQKVVIHHTALQGYRGLSEGQSILLSIQKLHMNERNFSDIGYNFLVGGDGVVFEGRGWAVVGAHTKGHNHDSLGIAFMGNFNDDSPSKEAMVSVRRLLAAGVSKGFLHPQFGLYGHRDLGSTECPGLNLYTQLHQLRSTS